MKFNEAWEQFLQGKTIESCETGGIYEPVFDMHDKEDIVNVKVNDNVVGFSEVFLSLMEITGEWKVL